MTLRHFILCTAAAALAACSNSSTKDTDTASNETVAAQAETMEIVWEDLMPIGEEALLAEMYSDYYEELEARMIQDAQRLQEAGKNQTEFDLGSISEGSANDTMEQIGTFNVVESLNGTKVRIPGYVVPLDFNAESEHKEFLLVPYCGACLHTPPPPPNQILFVKANPAAKGANIYYPV